MNIFYDLMKHILRFDENILWFDENILWFDEHILWFDVQYLADEFCYRKPSYHI